MIIWTLLFAALLVWLLYMSTKPGGLIGTIMMYRVSFYVVNQVRTNAQSMRYEAFPVLEVPVSNKRFWVNQADETHRLLLEVLAEELAKSFGFAQGGVRLLPGNTVFCFHPARR